MTAVAAESPAQAEVAALLASADAWAAALYPAQSRHAATIEGLLAADTRFFVPRRHGRAVGCGGYARLGPEAAELKRLFVDPSLRGQGVGVMIVRAVEAAAAAEGVRRLLLETGVKSAEAWDCIDGWDLSSVRRSGRIGRIR